MSISEIPNTQHYAIITETTVYIPGDERSRTNPGHGYPASSETYMLYKVCKSREDWEAEIHHLTDMGRSFRAIMANPAKITTKIDININENTDDKLK